MSQSGKRECEVCKGEGYTVHGSFLHICMECGGRGYVEDEPKSTPEKGDDTQEVKWQEG